MFQNIEEYIKKSRDDRRSHLRLHESCVEIGGNSKEFRGLLAHHLKTTIPRNINIHLCHACHNGKCSNINHLYWGTNVDNSKDQFDNGRCSIWESTVRKYGLEEAHKRRRLAQQRRTDERSKLTSQEIERRKHIIESCRLKKRGWLTRASNELGISHTSVKRFTQ